MKPLTRKEQFFNYILGKTTSKPKPMTREEKILDEFEPVMTVNVNYNISDTTCTFDKTFVEIAEHYNNGGDVRFIAKKYQVGRLINFESDVRVNVVFDYKVAAASLEYHFAECMLDSNNSTAFADWLVSSKAY